jgi:NADH-quinone oxidoreductase subunit F
MLVSGIPSYRLSREVLQKEIAAIIDDNVELKCNTALGRDFTIDRLFDVGFKAVFLAMGAHKSRRLNIEGEDLEGVYPALHFLKVFNLKGENLARGRVGVVGGGNSAVDAARVAYRQSGVDSVTIFYRRTREEMPALSEEVEAAVQEGIRLETLAAPRRIITEGGRLAGIECVRNRLAEFDASGRRSPVAVPGTEFEVPLDTLIVTIGDEPDIDYVSSMGIEVSKKGTVEVDPGTLATNRAGVFAGGDVVSGPNTVVEAIAAGKKAAAMIGHYIRGESLHEPPGPRLPRIYVEPPAAAEAGPDVSGRIEPPTLPVESRRRSFDEVEQSISARDATLEARRCLRCDLDFTKPRDEVPEPLEHGGTTS